MKTVKIAMIGAGNIANAHLESYAKVSGAKIEAICDINPERLKETADKFGIEKRYTDVEAMLAAEKELDAADVCVWNCNHAECSIAALNAGLHVLCEKPMAYSTEEAVEMEEVARKNGKLLMIGFVTRFDPQTLIAKDFIDKGHLGDIYYARAEYVRRHGAPGGWFCDKARSGGGPAIDLGVHVIDRARYLMGLPKPVSVYAVTSSAIGKRDYLKTHVGWVPKDAKPDDVSDVEDFATALIRFDNGAAISLETSYSINGENKSGLCLYGTKGGMNSGEGKLWTVMNDFMVDVDIKTENYKNERPMFEAEMAHFVECVAEGKTCGAPSEDGIVVMKILDAIYESARTGHEVIIGD